jgi:hypothetical protein
MTDLDRRIAVAGAEQKADEKYADMLDACYPTVAVGHHIYDPSCVLREVDPIAYREGFLEYTDGCCETCWVDPAAYELHEEWCEHYSEECDMEAEI